MNQFLTAYFAFYFCALIWFVVPNSPSVEQENINDPRVMEFHHAVSEFSLDDYQIDEYQRARIARHIAPMYGISDLPHRLSHKQFVSLMMEIGGSLSSEQQYELLRLMVRSSKNQYTAAYSRRTEKRKVNYPINQQCDGLIKIKNLVNESKPLALDLADNPGGTLRCALEIVRYLWSSEDSYIDIYSNHGVRRIHISQSQALPKGVVKVSSRTASAAELITWMMMENGWKVEFETGSISTFGKNSGQSSRSLFNDTMEYRVSNSEFRTKLCQESACKINLKDVGGKV